MSQFSFDPFPGGEAVTDYATRYRRTDVPPLEVAPPLDLFPSQPTTGNYTPQFTWADPWPFGDRAGVYLIYSASFDLSYVGTAQRLSSRLSQHFYGRDCCVFHENFGPQSPRFVINIAVPVNMRFEAPALEAYLIEKLKPVGNVKGK